MAVDPNHLLLFHHVIQAGSFAGAARALGVSRQAVSEQIGRLEDSLGVRLLERSTRSLRPTDIGRLVARRSERLHAELGELVAEVEGAQSAPVGTLRVSVPGAFGRRFLPEILAALRARHPELRVEADITDRFVRLFDEDVDVAIRVGHPQDGRLIGRRLGVERLLIVASPAMVSAHPGLMKRPPAGAPVVGVAEEEVWLLGGELRVQPAVVLNDLQAVARAAMEGLGVARLPRFSVQAAIDEGRLIQLGVCGSPAREIWAVYPSRRYLAPKVRCFVEAVAAHAERVFVDEARSRA